MKIGYADPPYIGCAHLYKDHPDYAGEVDHAALVARLESEFDGWILHASATPLSMAILAPLVLSSGARWCSWRKGFAAFKKNVSVAYAWEPVIIKAARKPVVSKAMVFRDWINSDDIQHSITLKRGLTGAKPEKVCHWAFELAGADPDEDDFYDLFPGTGAASRAWETWVFFSLPLRFGEAMKLRTPEEVAASIDYYNGNRREGYILKRPGPCVADGVRARDEEIAKAIEEVQAKELGHHSRGCVCVMCELMRELIAALRGGK